MVKPIDMQVSLSKAVEAGRAQQIMQSSSQLGQQQLTAELDEQRTLAHSRAGQAEEADGPENRVDDHPDSGRHGRRPRRQRAEDEPETQEHSLSPSDSSFDVVA
jgi:hypothetical protein